MPRRKKKNPARARRVSGPLPRRKTAAAVPPRRPAKPLPRRVVSLPRAVSKFGIASRAEALFLILEGRVHVNGAVERNPSHRVDPNVDRIMVDNVPARPARPLIWMLNKPVGYVTTTQDPDGRPTVYDLLPRGMPHVSAVGRLDFQSSGLLLFTNDTQLAAKVTAPESHLAKVYEATLDAPIADAEARRLEQGVVVQGRRTKPARFQLAQPGASLRVTVTLYEGRNRQVRRMFESVGRTVVWLQRVRIGPVVLDGLGAGEARALSADEVKALRRALR